MYESKPTVCEPSHEHTASTLLLNLTCRSLPRSHTSLSVVVINTSIRCPRFLPFRSKRRRSRRRRRHTIFVGEGRREEGTTESTQKNSVVLEYEDADRKLNNNGNEKEGLHRRVRQNTHGSSWSSGGLVQVDSRVRTFAQYGRPFPSRNSCQSDMVPSRATRERKRKGETFFLSFFQKKNKTKQPSPTSSLLGPILRSNPNQTQTRERRRERERELCVSREENQ